MMAGGIDRRIAREAARWFVRLQSPGVDESQHQACARWRAERPEHERAWQLAESFSARSRLIPESLASATLDRVPDQARRRAIKALALLIMAGPAALIVQRSAHWQQFAADMRSGTGERRDFTLTDGTQIQLNTDSAIDIAFTDHQRKVRLVRGEILITTGKDSLNRPFVLETAEGAIQPIGTRFAVRQFSDSTQVAVLEGAVQVSTLTQPDRVVRLDAGQQLRFDKQRIEPACAVQPEQTDWSRGVLKADHMRVADFARELSRYRPGLLRCDPAVAELQVSGAFQLFDTDQALDALAQVLPVSILYRTRYWVTITPRSV
jgi:transmembrane sensor